MAACFFASGRQARDSSNAAASTTNTIATILRPFDGGSRPTLRRTYSDRLTAPMTRLNGYILSRAPQGEREEISPPRQVSRGLLMAKTQPGRTGIATR